jgi:pre-60S factor REI1
LDSGQGLVDAVLLCSVSLSSLEIQLSSPSRASSDDRDSSNYFRQRFPNRTPAENSRKVLKDVVSAYRMKGWTPMEKKAAEKKARDIRYMARVRQEQWVKLGFKANKFQPHFRAQTNF